MNRYIRRWALQVRVVGQPKFPQRSQSAQFGWQVCQLVVTQIKPVQLGESTQFHRQLCELIAREMKLSQLGELAQFWSKSYDEIYGNASFQKAYLDRAQVVGMKVIIALNNPTFYSGNNFHSKFPALAQTCNCTDNSGFIRYVVNLVKNHPAVWGYYIGDEVDPGDHDQMKSELADLVHQLDPKHPRLFIDSAGQATAVWHGNSPFYDTTDVIGSDFYPVREELSGYPGLDQTAIVASGIQAYANAHGENAAIVLQAFSRSAYGIAGDPYPTADQMETMLSQTLANAHPRIILWYSYDDTMSSDNAAQNWHDLQATIARNIPKY